MLEKIDLTKKLEKQSYREKMDHWNWNLAGYRGNAMHIRFL